jgi:hypothetical protein
MNFVSLSTKYRGRQNIGEEKILATPKYGFRQNIASDKYQRRKNVGDNKILLTTKY